MAPFDLPHVAHDMILRFVGTNFSAILDGTAKISSTVGTESKPVLVETIKASSTPVSGVGKSPEQDKAMWEGVFLLVFYLFCMSDKSWVQHITTPALLRWSLSSFLSLSEPSFGAEFVRDEPSGRRVLLTGMTRRAYH